MSVTPKHVTVAGFCRICLDQSSMIQSNEFHELLLDLKGNAIPQIHIPIVVVPCFRSNQLRDIHLPPVLRCKGPENRIGLGIFPQAHFCFEPYRSVPTCSTMPPIAKAFVCFAEVRQFILRDKSPCTTAGRAHNTFPFFVGPDKWDIGLLTNTVTSVLRTVNMRMRIKVAVASCIVDHIAGFWNEFRAGYLDETNIFIRHIDIILCKTMLPVVALVMNQERF